jgi:hypothetical protein
MPWPCLAVPCPCRGPCVFVSFPPIAVVSPQDAPAPAVRELTLPEFLSHVLGDGAIAHYVRPAGPPGFRQLHSDPQSARLGSSPHRSRRYTPANNVLDEWAGGLRAFLDSFAFEDDRGDETVFLVPDLPRHVSDPVLIRAHDPPVQHNAHVEMEKAQADALSHILAEMASKADLEREIERLQADLTWRMIAVVGFFGTIMTLLNAFIG